MKYCKKCLMPDTKPYISFDKEGVCNACRAHDRKNQVLDGIDWTVREKEFDAIIEETRAKKAPFYDVLVPVSGGNLKEKTAREIWRGSELFNSLRDRRNLKGICLECGQREMCGGCRARALSHSGALFGEDPKCPLTAEERLAR